MKKETNFELNLVPFIDMLSVCIIFLILTAVWIQAGSLEIKQGMGGEATSQEKTPTLLAYFNASNDIEVSVKDSGSSEKTVLKSVNGQPDVKRLESSVQKIKSRYSTMTAALVMPDKRTSYQNMMSVMDILKKSNVSVGIVPL